jgi:hypothetical protein
MFCQDFLEVMREKVWELDNEIHFKDTFRVFSKDEEGKYIHCKLTMAQLTIKFSLWDVGMDNKIPRLEYLSLI